MKQIKISEINKKTQKLIKSAIAVRRNAYAKYSNFKVGAGILTKSGEVFTGANCENVSFGGTVCAERAAMCSAISAGHRDFLSLAVASENAVSPCGICRQFLCEFGDFDIYLIDVNQPDFARVTKLSILLPYEFSDF